jgi:hypothetical protein
MRDRKAKKCIQPGFILVFCDDMKEDLILPGIQLKDRQMWCLSRYVVKRSACTEGL